MSIFILDEYITGVRIYSYTLANYIITLFRK